jgi:molybdenum cofactor cytidylyltransferase
VIPAIVLAAGASARMGRPKALLTIGGRTFVRRILDTLRDAGVKDALVVVRPDAEEVVREIALAGIGRAIVNADPARGKLSSLATALDTIGGDPRVVAALVTLVDVPLVSAATVSALLERAARSPASILRAVYDHRHGHPVIFKRGLFDALRRADPSAGAKDVLRAHAIEDVEVDDPGVVQDVDTPDDYSRVIEGRPGPLG